MANNYLEFSEVLEKLNKRERNWLARQLESVTHDQFAQERGLPASGEDDDNWQLARFLAEDDELRKEAIENSEHTGFQYAFEDEGKTLWLYAEQSANIEYLAAFVQKFLRQFRPQRSFRLSYSCTCSKPRVGEFGGGALFVTANRIEYCSTDDWLEDCTKQHELTVKADALAAEAAKLGIDPAELDELVHDAKGQEAAALNNDGLESQVAYLVEAMGFDEVQRRLQELRPK